MKRRQALAMIAAMDDGLGRIRAKLQAMGAEQNTLIFFIGDNGAPLGTRVGRLHQSPDGRAERNARRRWHPHAVRRRLAGPVARRRDL